MGKIIGCLAGVLGVLLIAVGIKDGIADHTVGVIGGADGPTSIFVSGHIEGGFAAAAIAAGVIILLILIIWLVGKKMGKK